jgi:hypothetical protein
MERDMTSAALFDSAMVSMSRLIAQDVLATYDFHGAGGLLDVGGGAGALLIARYASSIEQLNFCAGKSALGHEEPCR